MEKPDISDKPDNTDISDKWDGNLENMSGGGPDKPDRLDPSLNLSGLSGRPWGLLEENLRIPEIGTDISDITHKPDISDKTNSRNYLSSFSTECFANRTFVSPKDTGLLDEYEERLAIAEYDGLQSPIQAQRIAYLDAFVSVLVTLPYDSNKEDWLPQRLNAAQNWLLDQRIKQPK